MSLDPEEDGQAKIKFKHLPPMFQIKQLCFQKQGGTIQQLTLPIDKKDPKHEDRLNKFLDGLNSNQKQIHAAVLQMASILQEELPMRPHFDQIYSGILMPKVKINEEVANASEEEKQKIYVSHEYFEGIYQSMKKDQSIIHENILAETNQMLERCNKFMNFAEIEFPALKQMAEAAGSNSDTVIKMMEVDICRKVKMSHIRDVWRGLKRNMFVEKRKKLMKNKMLDNFRCQYMHGFFEHWKKQTKTVSQVNKVNSVKGATIQIAEFKEKLKLFDVAFAKLDKEKLGKKQYRKDQGCKTPQDVFGDFKQLLDATVSKMENDLHGLVGVSIAAQEQKYQELEAKVQSLCQNEFTENVNNKINFLEKMIQQITYEQGELNSLIGKKKLSVDLIHDKELDIMNRKIMVNMLNISQMEHKHTVMLQNFKRFQTIVESKLWTAENSMSHVSPRMLAPIGSTSDQRMSSAPATRKNQAEPSQANGHTTIYSNIESSKKPYQSKENISNIFEIALVDQINSSEYKNGKRNVKVGSNQDLDDILGPDKFDDTIELNAKVKVIRPMTQMAKAFPKKHLGNKYRRSSMEEVSTYEQIRQRINRQINTQFIGLDRGCSSSQFQQIQLKNFQGFVENISQKQREYRKVQKQTYKLPYQAEAQTLPAAPIQRAVSVKRQPKKLFVTATKSKRAMSNIFGAAMSIQPSIAKGTQSNKTHDPRVKIDVGIGHTPPGRGPCDHEENQTFVNSKMQMGSSELTQGDDDEALVMQAQTVKNTSRNQNLVQIGSTGSDKN